MRRTWLGHAAETRGRDSRFPPLSVPTPAPLRNLTAQNQGVWLNPAELASRARVAGAWPAGWGAGRAGGSLAGDYGMQLAGIDVIQSSISFAPSVSTRNDPIFGIR